MAFALPKGDLGSPFGETKSPPKPAELQRRARRRSRFFLQSTTVCGGTPKNTATNKTFAFVCRQIICTFAPQSRKTGADGMFNLN
ncbi:hypothetical protein CHX27_04545 [Flavobacterium aurantiibacter]|uniref:Uncharacterized protein n=1 Tax=Flavobacterium aurantiibacter TaxID=2023067 RepID=A0A255ZY55_9FLAO|nr:hypothetical protein CHX27_04545 [Flavobacterium aurantiibacter]